MIRSPQIDRSDKIIAEIFDPLESEKSVKLEAEEACTVKPTSLLMTFNEPTISYVPNYTKFKENHDRTS